MLSSSCWKSSKLSDMPIPTEYRLTPGVTDCTIGVNTSKAGAWLDRSQTLPSLTSPIVLRGQVSDGSAAGGGSTSPVRGVVFQEARAPTSAEMVDSMITRYMSWR